KKRDIEFRDIKTMEDGLSKIYKLDKWDKEMNENAEQAILCLSELAYHRNPVIRREAGRAIEVLYSNAKFPGMKQIGRAVGAAMSRNDPMSNRNINGSQSMKVRASIGFYRTLDRFMDRLLSYLKPETEYWRQANSAKKLALAYLQDGS